MRKILRRAVTYLIYCHLTAMVRSTIDHLELVMPRYAVRGSEATLKCEHSVPPEQLYKVEWKKGDDKLFQYVKGRRPPFRVFPIPGAVLNKTYSNEKQIHLSKLEFSAAGSYLCVVSTETPIFTKDSDPKNLIIIEPQDEDPKITFNKDTYVIGEVLAANCTSAPAKPPPHITWLINGEKAPETVTKSFANGLVHGHGYFEIKSATTKQLAIKVSELHVGEDGELSVTCMATIPGYISDEEEYVDVRKRTVQIGVELGEDPAYPAPVEAISSGLNLHINILIIAQGLLVVSIRILTM